MSISTLCTECNATTTHHLCATCKNALVCTICLNKRGYDYLNYRPYKSCDPNNNYISITQEVTINEPASKCPKLSNSENSCISTKANSNDSVSTLSIKSSLLESNSDKKEKK